MKIMKKLKTLFYQISYDLQVIANALHNITWKRRMRKVVKNLLTTEKLSYLSSEVNNGTDNGKWVWATLTYTQGKLDIIPEWDDWGQCPGMGIGDILQVPLMASYTHEAIKQEILYALDAYIRKQPNALISSLHYAWEETVMRHLPKPRRKTVTIPHKRVTR
jgi:hypothetical protein